MCYSIQWLFLISYCLTYCWLGLRAETGLRIVKQWAQLDFEFPSEAARQIALDQHYYIPGNPVPIDVDVHYRPSPEKSRIFVTIPRFDVGRPVTLGIVGDDGRIRGYPDYSWHDNQGTNCDGITSVYRVAIDKCERLWVMDSGRIGSAQMCTPQLLAFDLRTDQLIYRHRVNSSNYFDTSLLITPVVDTERGPYGCKNTFVYIADVSGFGLLVVDVANDRSWRVTHRNFFPYPNHGTFTIVGESFDMMDGVLGMALSPPLPDGDRLLYFHALSSVTENVVRTSVLKNESFMHDPNADPDSIIAFPENRPNQSAAQAMNKDGILFFGLMDPPSIWCWNAATEFSRRNFHQIAINRETLQFASGVKIVNNLKGQEELWILTPSFQRIMTGSLSSDRVNFRILAENIPTLLKNSPCSMSSVVRTHRQHANVITADGPKRTLKWFI